MSGAELIAQDIANEMRIAFPVKSVTVELSETENNTAVNVEVGVTTS